MSRGGRRWSTRIRLALLLAGLLAGLGAVGAQAAPAGELRIEALLALPGAERPFALELEVDGRPQRLGADGRLQLQLPAGEVALRAAVAGATVSGPERVRVPDGGSVTARFVVRPVVELSLHLDRDEAWVGERVRATVRAETAFAGRLPADLALTLPPLLTSDDTVRRSAPLSASRPLELTVTAEAREAGAALLQARLAPWGLTARAPLTLRRPVDLELRLTALDARVAAGGRAELQLELINRGDEAARDVRVTVALPPRVRGEAPDLQLDLAPRERRTLRFGVHPEDAAAGMVEIRADAVHGATLLQRHATLEVLAPRPQLQRRLRVDAALPGERIEVELTVRNDGRAPLRYELADVPPEWLEPLADTAWQGALAPGASAVHTYPARVRFGPAAHGELQADLRWPGGRLRQRAELQRLLLPLELTVSPARLLTGGEGELTLRAVNPTPRPLRFELALAPDAGLTLGAAERLVELPAGGEAVLRVPWRVERDGRLALEASLLLAGVPVGFPARAEVWARPPLEPQRRSEFALPFRLQRAGAGERLLLRQPLPAGARYEPGSSRLDGVRIDDPLLRRDADRSYLLWLLPFRPQGELGYALLHRDPLPPLPPPALTLASGGISGGATPAGAGARELPLQGDASFAELAAATPLAAGEAEGLIRQPAAGAVLRPGDLLPVVLEGPYPGPLELRLNGAPVGDHLLGTATYDATAGRQRLQFYGLRLEPGRNELEARAGERRERLEVWRAARPTTLELRPLDTAADGLTPLTLEVLALDDQGLASGFGPLTVAVDHPPLDPDAFPQLPGHQLLLRDGRALLRLEPLPSPRRLQLALFFDELELRRELRTGGVDAPLWLWQGSARLQVAADGVEASGVARGYGEAPLADGTLQLALDSGGGLAAPAADPRFPVTGSGREAEPGLRSADAVALRYQRDDLEFGYQHGPLAVPGLGELGQATAARGEVRGARELPGGEDETFRAAGFVALLFAEERVERFEPDGTRAYALRGPLQPGSERVSWWVGEREVVLERLLDYSIDYGRGLLLLQQPRWRWSADGQVQHLEVRYAPADSARDRWAAGAGFDYRSGPWRLQAGAARLGNAAADTAAGAAAGARFGVQLDYREGGFDARARYHAENGRGRLELQAGLQRGPLQLQGSLQADEQIQGRALLAYAVSGEQRLLLEHRADDDGARSGALLEHRAGALSAAAGVGYRWREAQPLALLQLRYRQGDLLAEVDHDQALAGGAPSQSRLRASYGLGGGLSLEAGARYRWDGELEGGVGLEQELGDATLSLHYQLPNSAGSGNRARFGVQAPLPLDEHWSLGAGAGYERALGAGPDRAAASLELRYRAEALTATAAADVAWEEGQRGVRVALRGGAAGQLATHHALSVDASYRLTPEPDGRFTAAYALRLPSWSLLAYQRLEHAGDWVASGEVAAALHPQALWQLRPALAYRLPLARPDAAALQASLGGSVYLGRLGFGATAHHLWQPGGDSSSAVALEASARLAEPLWLTLGYTLLGFDGLTPDTRSGVYLRLDAAGGTVR